MSLKHGTAINRVKNGLRIPNKSLFYKYPKYFEQIMGHRHCLGGRDKKFAKFADGRGVGVKNREKNLPTF